MSRPQTPREPAPRAPAPTTEVPPPAGAIAADPAAALRAAIARARPSIPVGYLYDDLGSRLFAAITALDEYYPTRTEAGILAQNLPAMLAARPVEGCTLIDLGAGNCEKAAGLFGAVRPARYVAVDVSVDFLAAALDELHRRFPAIEMSGVGLDFAERLLLPASVPTPRRLFFYPGSSIGNFAPEDAVRFLADIRAAMGGDGTLWIGVDLHKDRAVLERAYDDELGVTAAFIRNVLRNVNRIAGTDFVLADWRYVAAYDERQRCVVMELEAMRDLTVRWPGGERRFTRGERIHAENSFKHTIDGFTALLQRAGMRRVGVWTDDADRFAFFVAEPA